MKTITEIKQDWPRDRLLIQYAIHNVCNYKCWYCFPGSNTGDMRWPDLDLITSNFLYLIEYYKIHLGKTKFQLNLLGGEPTLWPKLSEFIKNIKDALGEDISIMITTNGSRTISWWESNGHYYDHVLISCHPDYVDPAHVIKVADRLYEKNVHTDVTVLMDPTKWNIALDIIKQLKSSRRRWPIIASQVIHETINYTKEQKKVLTKYLKRFPNPFWFRRVNKEHKYKTSIVYSDGTKQKISKTYLLINDLNHFQGWDCDIGIDAIAIHFNGKLSGTCAVNLYNLPFTYNLYDVDFQSKFNPVLTSTTCTMMNCDCQPEINISKRIIDSSKKIIPIKNV